MRDVGKGTVVATCRHIDRSAGPGFRISINADPRVAQNSQRKSLN